MIVNLTPVARTTMMQSLQQLIDRSAGVGRIELRAAPMPGTPGGVDGIGAVQVTYFLARPAGAVADQALIIAAPLVAQRAASADIAWARVTDGDGVPVLDLDVTVTGGGGAVQIDRVDGYVGAFVTLSSVVLQG